MSTPPALDLAPLSFEQFYAEHFKPLHATQLAREEQWQDEAFAAQPHTVCGLELRGMTPYDLLLLHGCENPFITGGVITPEHIAQFLAILADPAPRGWLARSRFFRHVAALPYAQAIAEIRAYRDRMFASADLPTAAPASPSTLDPRPSTTSSPVPMSFLAPLVINIASATGWSEADILGMRLDKLFQYRRAIAARETGRTGYPAADVWISRALEAYGRYQATGELPGQGSESKDESR